MPAAVRHLLMYKMKILGSLKDLHGNFYLYDNILVFGQIKGNLAILFAEKGLKVT